MPTADDLDLAAEGLLAAARRADHLLDGVLRRLAAVPVRGGVLGADIDALAGWLRRNVDDVIGDISDGARVAAERAAWCRQLEQQHRAYADAIVEHRRLVALAESDAALAGTPPVLPPAPVPPPVAPGWAVLRGV